jgi:mono/diheme cytochrome c family protein
MEAETVFIILGLALVVLALVVSFLGLRMESFPPSRGAMLAGIGVFVLVIGTTAVFAWTGSEDEQEHRDELIAAGEEPSPAEVVQEMHAASAEATAEAEGEAPPEGGAPAEGAEGGGETASADGAALFDSEGCAGCHTLEAAGATGTTGPDLDTALADADAAFIEESIVDPEAELEKGFPSGVMPSDYAQVLSPEDLEALVAYIAESVGAKG